MELNIINIINERFEKKGGIKRGSATFKHNIIYKKLGFILIVFILFILINLKEKHKVIIKESSFIKNKTKINDIISNDHNFKETNNISHNYIEIGKTDNISHNYTEIEKIDNISNNYT